MGIGSNDKDYGFINLQTCIQSPFCFWVVNCRWWLSSSTISIYIAVPYIANSAKKKSWVWFELKEKEKWYTTIYLFQICIWQNFFNNVKFVSVQQYCVLYVVCTSILGNLTCCCCIYVFKNFGWYVGAVSKIKSTNRSGSMYL